MVNCEPFFNLVSIEEAEKSAAEAYIRLRGLHEHIAMASYLQGFLQRGKPTYKEVATAFRYDKRIRRIVYKYVGLIEEYFRAYLYNTFSSLQAKVEDEYAFDSSYISRILFSQLIDRVWTLDDRYKNELFGNENVLRKNLDALVQLRNAISHNRTLITYDAFSEVTLSDGRVGNSLLLNLCNLYSLLPHEIAISFKREINTARNQGRKKRDNQVRWELPSFLIIKISG